MNNSEIHNGLTENYIRDFLAETIMNSIINLITEKRATIPYFKDDPIGWQIMDKEADIAHLKNQISTLKERMAIEQILHTKGWQEFDVSDITVCELAPTRWLNFIGTEQEYKALLTKIEKEKPNA